jgi:hypothetical protein
MLNWFVKETDGLFYYDYVGFDISQNDDADALTMCLLCDTLLKLDIYE